MLSKVEVKRFNTLIETNALINSDYRDLGSLMTRIADSAAELGGGEAARLFLLNRETRQLRLEVFPATAGTELKRRPVKAGEGIAGWVALHNKPIIVNDAGNDKRYRDDIEKEFNCPVKNLLAVPLRAGDECLGVVELINKKSGKRFTDEDLEWLEIFAGQAGLAVFNARNLENAHEKIDRLLHDQIKSSSGFDTIAVKSAVMREKMEIIERAAKTDSPVLILGESGTEKEIFAERIHLKSRRRGKPFVKANCAAVPEELLEGELFGRVKGAFPAAANRIGSFELADGGTVFLDEVGGLPPELQEKLLRFIQERTFEKAGADTGAAADVRILAAANEDMEKRVEQGEFLSELYYRLNVFPLHIPPLRQRAGDIPALADFFLRKFSRETGKKINGFSERAMETILSYSWPGNTRELENCVERACITGKGGTIEAEDLFLEVQDARAVSANKSRKLKTAENIYRARYIRQVLEENNWNQTETAKALDIQRTYLSRLIKELHISNSKE